MPTLKKKRLPVAPKRAITPAKRPPPRKESQGTSRRRGQNSKQSRVIKLLQSPRGATIAAMMKATGWQQHSVRGFLAGVVRKRLNLELTSEVVNDDRVYRIARPDPTQSAASQIKR